MVVEFLQGIGFSAASRGFGIVVHAGDVYLGIGMWRSRLNVPVDLLNQGRRVRDAKFERLEGVCNGKR